MSFTASDLVDDVKTMNGEVVDPLPFIVSAVNLLNRLPCVQENYTEEDQKILAANLALHLASASRGRMIEEKIGDATEKFETNAKYGEGLNSTQWGRNVLLLDTAGCMSYLGKKRIRIVALGPVPRGSTVDTSINDPEAAGL